MTKEVINTNNAPEAIGPYSQGDIVGDFVYTYGQIPLNQETGEFVTDIKLATKQSMENIKAILEEAGTSLNNVVKTSIFLKDLNDFEAVNEVYGTYFIENKPARSCVQVAKLPKDAVIEIEAIAVK